MEIIKRRITMLWSFAILILGMNANEATQIDNFNQISDPENMASDEKTSALLRNILTHMDPRIRPHESGQDFKADILLLQQWTDPRLAFNESDHPKPMTVTHGIQQEIWTPDLFFPNEIDAQLHDVTVPNQLVRIYHNGSVEYALRVTLHSTCPMDLHNFPMDKQMCMLKVESFSYEDADLQLEWVEEHPVTIDEDLTLPEMELVEVVTSNCTKVYKTGSYHCLQIGFSLQRHYGYYILQTYIPTILITALSWVSFWINKEAVPARISLGVTTVLTMTTQLSGSKMDSPKVSYPKAIDVWMSACMIFVFAALVEYAMINAMMRDKDIMTPEHEPSESDDSKPTETNRLNQSYGFRPQSERQICNRRRKIWSWFADYDRAQMIDNLCRFAFPFCFVLFNAIYWCVYLQDPGSF